MIFTTGVQHVNDPTVSDLRAAQSKFRDELWTGMLEAEYAGGDRVVFLFCGGTLECAFRLDLKTTQKRDAEKEWDSMLSAPPSTLLSIRLTVASLRLAKIALEYPAPVEILQVKPGRLEHTFEQWNRQSYPNLATLEWTEAQGLAMLWPGIPIPSAAFLVASTGTWEGGEAVRQIFSSPFGDCDASRHAFASDGGAWEEYSFQHMFVSLLDAILKRYKDLTGLALLNALDRNINRVAFEQKLDFSITLGVITDRMFFAGLDELIAACKMLLAVAFEHIGVVLGQKLSRSLVQDALASLDIHSMRLIEKYSIDAFLGSPRVVQAVEADANV